MKDSIVSLEMKCFKNKQMENMLCSSSDLLTLIFCLSSYEFAAVIFAFMHKS